MNKLIKKQLLNCKVANISPYDDAALHIFIPKHTNGVDTIQIALNGSYLMEFAKYILVPYEGFTLHDNWNNGIIPKDRYVKAKVVKIMGKMIKVDAIGYDMKTKTDTGNVWTGWLPIKSVTVLEELDG